MRDYHKREKVKIMQTHVITSFKDSIALSSVILSGLSSDVCFFISGIEIRRESLAGRRQGKMKSTVTKACTKEGKGREITDRYTSTGDRGS